MASELGLVIVENLPSAAAFKLSDDPSAGTLDLTLNTLGDTARMAFAPHLGKRQVAAPKAERRDVPIPGVTELVEKEIGDK